MLYFIELEAYEQDGVIVTYKIFSNRLYIYSARCVTYTSSESPNGGVNKPWTN